MSDPTVHNLNLNLNNRAALNLLEIHSEVDISVNFGEITSITHLDQSVLVITFTNGELRLDLSYDDLFIREPFCALRNHKIQMITTRRSELEE